MFFIGLTGGIGSGKTAAAKRFITHGVTVINVDDIAREIVAPGTTALAKITDRFGETVLHGDRSLDRTALRKIVFNDSKEREWLEQLTHPLVGELTLKRKNAARKSNEPPYRIIESPLLFESGQHKAVDRCLLIDTEESIQIQRVMERDNTSQQQAKAIIAAQMSRQEKQRLADDIIENSDTLETLYQNIDKLHAQYCELALQL